jgi:hypothetical protein
MARHRRTGRVPVDLRTDERRASTLADVADAARLIDAVPQIGYLGPSARALDLAPEIRAPRELHARLANTSKHVQIEVPAQRPDVEALLERAELAAGADLRERPIVSAVLPITSPLALDGDRLEAAIALAEAGMPCGVVAEPVAESRLRHARRRARHRLVEALAGVVSLQPSRRRRRRSSGRAPSHARRRARAAPDVRRTRCSGWRGSSSPGSRSARSRRRVHDGLAGLGLAGRDRGGSRRRRRG